MIDNGFVVELIRKEVSKNASRIVDWYQLLFITSGRVDRAWLLVSGTNWQQHEDRRSATHFGRLYYYIHTYVWRLLLCSSIIDDVESRYNIIHSALLLFARLRASLSWNRSPRNVKSGASAISFASFDDRVGHPQSNTFLLQHRKIKPVRHRRVLSVPAHFEIPRRKEEQKVWKTQFWY
jgi:hypothetical protein